MGHGCWVPLDRSNGRVQGPGHSRLVLSCRSFLLFCLGVFNWKLQLRDGWSAGADRGRYCVGGVTGVWWGSLWSGQVWTGVAIGICIENVSSRWGGRHTVVPFYALLSKVVSDQFDQDQKWSTATSSAIDPPDPHRLQLSPLLVDESHSA